MTKKAIRVKIINCGLEDTDYYRQFIGKEVDVIEDDGAGTFTLPIPHEWRSLPDTEWSMNEVEVLEWSEI